MKNLKSLVKSFIPPSMRPVLSRSMNTAVKAYYTMRCFANKRILLTSLLKRKKKLHLGCGDIRLRNSVNVDCRPTCATDIIHDCTDLSYFPEQCFSEVYSHAFFEHLFPDQRIPCLKNIYRVLDHNGIVFFAGIPDFKRVAHAYLNKERGLLSERFDLYHVQRFTHDPVIADCMSLKEDGWIEQMHKSLFDDEETAYLLEKAGFKSYVIFNYCFKEEHLPISLGFIAFKNKPDIDIDMSWITSFIKKRNKDITQNTIIILLNTIMKDI